MPNINDLLEGHVTLEVECLDRLYLNGWVPRLASGGGLRLFLGEHLGKPVPSPVVLGQISRRFVEQLRRYAEQQEIPIIRFQRGERKDEVAQRWRKKRTVRDEVVFIGVAQEKALTYSGRKQQGSFNFQRDKSVYVNHYYFYVDDEDFGPAFLKVCSYAPWGLKLCLNGHEWAKRQLAKRGLPFEALDNGFLRCDDPAQLQAICDALGPAHIERFLCRWLERLPLPLSDEDRQAGYDYQLSIWQLEVSRTQIFDRPLRGREFFEEVMRDNLDLGRPDRLQLVFERQVRKNTPGRFRTRVIQDGVNPSLHIQYKQCQLKQYFKEGRGLRTETTFGNSKDFRVNKGLANLNYLQRLGRRINRRLLEVERVSHNCGLSADSIQGVVQPTVTPDGHKAPGLRFGQPRVMALFVALSRFQHLIDGFQNRDLRAQVARLLGVQFADYSATQMSYDLRRLRRKGLIFRPPGIRRYFLTPWGWKVARVFCRLEARVFRPAIAAFGDEPSALPRPLLQKVDAELDQLVSAGFPAPKAA
jgi:hypothetical protein